MPLPALRSFECDGLLVLQEDIERVTAQLQHGEQARAAAEAALQAHASGWQQAQDDAASAVRALQTDHRAAVTTLQQQLEQSKAEAAAGRAQSDASAAVACSALQAALSECKRVEAEVEELRAAAASAAGSAGVWEAHARASDALVLKMREEVAALVDNERQLKVRHRQEHATA
jgi:type IV secretory pathway VirJ component